MSYWNEEFNDKRTTKERLVAIFTVIGWLIVVGIIINYLTACKSITQTIHDERLVQGCYSTHTAAEVGLYVDGRFVKTGALCTKDLPECYYFKSNNMGVEVTVGNEVCNNANIVH